MNILITGGSGFIGSALVKSLSNHEVSITGRSNEQDTKCPCLSYTFHDLNWKSIPAFDVIFHQGAVANTLHPNQEDFYLVNFQYSKELFEKATECGCKHFVYASSCAVYGNAPSPFSEDGPTTPLNAYGASKAVFDDWVIPWSQQAGVVAVGLRYSNVYGCGENHKGKSASMIWQLAKQIYTGQQPEIFKWGEQCRDFVYIDDVVQANLLAWKMNKSNVFNVGSGKATSFNEIISIIQRILNTHLDTKYKDNPIEEYFQTHTVCNLKKSQTMLGYNPEFDIEKGIEKYLTLAFQN
jgi:ADP-L-glycero-D-manno-heptose 6-epimerase